MCGGSTTVSPPRPHRQTIPAVSLVPQSGPRTNDAANTLLLEIPINADSSDQIAIDTVNRLRSSIVPEAIEASSAEALVTGTTAFSIDFVDKMNSRLPITIGFVIVTSFLVLVVMFRSLLLPLVAILLNLLAVGAALRHHEVDLPGWASAGGAPQL